MTKPGINANSGVSYKLRDINTISWRLGYIAANVREVNDTKFEVVKIYHYVNFVLKCLNIQMVKLQTW